MKASVHLTALNTPTLTADNFTIEVEYTIEEFTTLLNTYPQIVTLILAITKESNHD